MGIKDLNKFITKYSPNSITNYPLDTLSGYKIAIDVSNWSCIHWAIAQKQIVNSMDVTTLEINKDKIINIWLTRLLSSIKKLLNYKITPIFIFDGNYPIEKSDIINNRKKEKEKMHKKVLDYRIKIDNIPILDRDSNLIDDYRKILRQDSLYTYNESNLLKKILTVLGFPVNQSNTESDQLCAMLAREKLVDAVYSTDTDMLTFGTPLVFKSFCTDLGNNFFTGINLSRILEDTKLTQSMFIDLCIMVGCDYNNHKNIPRIGIIKSYTLIKEYYSIDNLPSKYDTTCLKHLLCRKMFSYKPSHTLCNDSINLDINIPDISSLLENHQILFEKYNILPLILDLQYSNNTKLPNHDFYKCADSLVKSYLNTSN